MNNKCPSTRGVSSGHRIDITTTNSFNKHCHNQYRCNCFNCKNESTSIISQDNNITINATDWTCRNHRTHCHSYRTSHTTYAQLNNKIASSSDSPSWRFCCQLLHQNHHHHHLRQQQPIQKHQWRSSKHFIRCQFNQYQINCWRQENGTNKGNHENNRINQCFDQQLPAVSNTQQVMPVGRTDNCERVVWPYVTPLMVAVVNYDKTSCDRLSGRSNTQCINHLHSNLINCQRECSTVNGFCYCYYSSSYSSQFEGNDDASQTCRTKSEVNIDETNNSECSLMISKIESLHQCSWCLRPTTPYPPTKITLVRESTTTTIPTVALAHHNLYLPQSLTDIVAIVRNKLLLSKMLALCWCCISNTNGARITNTYDSDIFINNNRTTSDSKQNNISKNRCSNSCEDVPSVSLCSKINQTITSNRITKAARLNREKLPLPATTRPRKSLSAASTNKEHRPLSFKSIISSIILLIALLPSFTLAGVPKLGTAYACEDKTLTIECEPGDIINIVRANFGRFSLTICNDHGNVDWSVNCMSQKSLRVLNNKCTHKQNCSVLATANLFGDPCPGTRKYLEAHYKCESAIQTTTVSSRISPPSWQLTSQPSVWSTSTIRTPTTSRTSGVGLPGRESLPYDDNFFNPYRTTTQRYNLPSTIDTRPKQPTHRVLPQSTTTATSIYVPNVASASNGGGASDIDKNVAATSSDKNNPNMNDAFDHDSVADERNRVTTLPPTLTDDSRSDSVNNNNHSKNGAGSKSYDGLINESQFCGPTQVRNLFWNITQAGDINVQPCPGGATGIAKWRCVFTSANSSDPNHSPATLMAIDSQSDSSSVSNNNNNHRGGVVNGSLDNTTRAMWYPATPDLTQCRSLWLNSLEIRVNQRDSSLISIANDLSQVTSSKTLYGGDMLVTTKIIQIMSDKMTYDIETFPDQRQRETTVLELLHGVVKTGSNLLDESQEPSWHDLSFEDQMRVATSLLTGLEDNAFLLADTINRERSVVQKVKNILLSIRILETRSIGSSEIFPDSASEQWDVSDDRIEIPRAALIENSEGGLVRVVFVAFDRLESILRPATVWMDSKLTTNTDSQLYNNESGKQAQAKKRILNSKVISASLGKGRHIQITEDIKLTLKHLIVDNVTSPSCVFWNYIDHSWSSDGCRVMTTNRTHTTCSCDHLTNFAILMDVENDVPQSFLAILDSNLRILIYISIAVSIVLIVVAIVTLKLFNGLLIKSCRTTIYRNLYLCLLFIEVLFLLGINMNQAQIFCGFTSAFLHCAFLCAAAWTFFEGYQLYLTLTNDDVLLEVEKSSRILWYYIFTYGLAILIVTIAVAINPYVYIQADYCVWMDQTSVFYSTFIAPIIIFIVVNLIYSAMAINVMAKKYKTSLKNKEHTRLASASSVAENVTMRKIKIVIFYLRCSFFFLLIFILTWLFAFLFMKNQLWKDEDQNYARNGWHLVYGYLFVFFNSFQGVYIFVFHCIQNEKIRREYCKFVQKHNWVPNCMRCIQTSATTSSSSNIQHQYVAGGGVDPGMTSSMQPNILQQPGMHSTGIIESSGTLSRAPQMGTKGRRMQYGIEGFTETGTLRGQILPIGAQTSPMSSTGSTQLIYNGGSNARHLQEWAYQHPELASGGGNGGINKNAFDERLLYYDANAAARNMKPSKSHDLDEDLGDDVDQQQQQHHSQRSAREGFHFTEGRPKKHRQKNNNASLTGSTRNIYPQHRKRSQQDDPEQGLDNDENSYLQNYRRYMQAEADAEFLNQYQRQLQQQQQQNYGASNYPAGMVNGRQSLTPQQVAAQRYYHQHGHNGHGHNYLEEPVYEEIVGSSQMSSTYGDHEMMSDEEEDMDQGVTDEEESTSRSNKDDMSSRQSSSRPLIKNNYNFDQSPSHSSMINGSPHQQRIPATAQPQVPSRNLSAILDDNNTVVCYLEPLSK